MKSRQAKRFEKGFHETMNSLTKRTSLLQAHNDLFYSALEMGKANALACSDETKQKFIQWMGDNINLMNITKCHVFEFDKLFVGEFIFEDNRKELTPVERTKLWGFFTGFCEGKNVDHL